MCGAKWNVEWQSNVRCAFAYIAPCYSRFYAQLMMGKHERKLRKCMRGFGERGTSALIRCANILFCSCTIHTFSASSMAYSSAVAVNMWYNSGWVQYIVNSKCVYVSRVFIQRIISGFYGAMVTETWPENVPEGRTCATTSIRITTTEKERQRKREYHDNAACLFLLLTTRRWFVCSFSGSMRLVFNLVNSIRNWL